MSVAQLLGARVTAAAEPVRRSRLGLGPFVLAVALLVGVALAVQPVRDPDFYWHLATGRWILEHHALPTHDLYTYTVSSHAWLDHEWLSELLMYLLFQAGGLLLLSLAFGAVTAVGLGCLLATVAGRGRPYPVVAAVLALAAFGLTPIFGPRTQMVTFSLACLELLWLQRYLEGRGRALYLLPLVVVLWANLHAGFVVAFAFLGLAVATEAVHWWGVRRTAAAHEERVHRQRLRGLCLVAAASAVASLATPHGVHLWGYAFNTQGSPAQQALIIEWASPDFHDPELLPFAAIILGFVAACSLRRPSLYQLLLCLATLGLALHSVRHLVFFVAAAVPVLVDGGTEAWRRWLPPFRGAALSRRTAFLGAVAVLLVAAVLSVQVGGALARQPAMTVKLQPVGAADWLGAHPEAGHRIFNEYSYAGYLEYRFYPDPNRRVFIFGEAALMGDPLLREYAAVAHLEPGWRQVLDRHGVDAVLAKRGSPIDDVLAGEPGWRLAYSDSTSAIYVRQSPATR